MSIYCASQRAVTRTQAKLLILALQTAVCTQVNAT